MTSKSRTESPAELRQRLGDTAYHITQEKGTEPAFTGKYVDNKADGTYRCVCCDAALFTSEHKYDSGSGWPSFWSTLAEDRVEVRKDTSHGMIREEVVCAECGAHLGHVFPDGPQPSGARFCINSCALGFSEDE